MKKILTASLLAAIACAALAEYPEKAVTIVVPFAAGGPTDKVARDLGDVLRKQLNQPVIIENVGGAGGTLGAGEVAKAAPDGYTILLVNPANAINATLYPKLPFNFLDDLAPIAGIIRVPNVMTVTKNFPAKNLAEFIDYAKKNPGKINMASSGSGTSVHLSGEMFKAMAGVDMKHVPYKGAGPATVDLIGGQVDVIFDNMPSIITHIRNGTVRALGVTSAQRSPAMPDTQAIADLVPGYEASAWFGAAAPKGTPPAIIARLNREFNAALVDPATRAKLQDLGGVTIPGTPEAFWALHKMEQEKWAKIVVFSGAKAE